MGRVKKKPVLALLCIVLSILTIVAMMPGMAYADVGKTVKQSKKEEKTTHNFQGSVSRRNENSKYVSSKSNASTDEMSIVLDSDLSESSYWNNSDQKIQIGDDNKQTQAIANAYPGKSFTLEERVDCSVFDYWSIAQMLKNYLFEHEQKQSLSRSITGEFNISLTVPSNIDLKAGKVSASNKDITVENNEIKSKENGNDTKTYTIPVEINTNNYTEYEYKRIGILSLSLPMSLGNENNDDNEYGKAYTISSSLKGTLKYSSMGFTFEFNVTDRQSKGGTYGDKEDYNSSLDQEYSSHFQDSEVQVEEGHYYSAYISKQMRDEIALAKLLQGELQKKPSSSLLTQSAKDEARKNDIDFYVKGLLNSYHPTFATNWNQPDGLSIKYSDLKYNDQFEGYCQSILQWLDQHQDYITVPRLLPDGTDCKADPDKTTTQITVGTPYKVTLYPDIPNKNYSRVMYVEQSNNKISKDSFAWYIKEYESDMPGYQFQYWTNSKDGKEDFFANDTSREINQNINLYAIWGKNTEKPVITGPDHDMVIVGYTDQDYDFSTNDHSSIEIMSESPKNENINLTPEGPGEAKLRFPQGLDVGKYEVTLKASNDAGTTTKTFTLTVLPLCLDADLQLTEINGKPTDDPSETKAVKVVSPGDQMTGSMVIDEKVIHLIDNGELFAWYDGPSGGPSTEEDFINLFSHSLKVTLEFPDYIKVDPKMITLDAETSRHWDIDGEIKTEVKSGHTFITLTLSNKNHIPTAKLLEMTSSLKNDSDENKKYAKFEKSLVDILSEMDEDEIRINFSANIAKTAPTSSDMTIKGNLETDLTEDKLPFSARQSEGGLYNSDPIYRMFFAGGGPGFTGYQIMLEGLLKSPNASLFDGIELNSEDHQYILEHFIKGWNIDKNNDGTYQKEKSEAMHGEQITLFRYHRVLPDGTDATLKDVKDKPTEPQLTLQTTPTTPTEPTTPTTPTTPTEPSKPEEHTITFQPNNGQPTFTQTVPDGGQAVLPEEPSKKGHKFIGWYTDSALTKAYDFSTPVKSDLTLYAKWKKGKPTPKPAKKKVTGILLPKVIAKGKHTQVLTWTALKNVDGYFIYTNHCDEGRLLHPFKKVADYKASKARVYTKKHLTTYDNYKYYVAAYKIKHGKKVIVRNSVTVHSVCGNTSARSTNVKAVKASRHAVTLKKGKTYRINASAYKVNKKHAFLDQTHCGLLRYLTADSKIASVDYNTGKVKAVKAGKTNVYILGVNGIRDKVTVTVK